MKQSMRIKVNDSLPANTIIPSDMVLASGSGLDRYISVESALLQVPRIAKARHINESSIDDSDKKYTGNTISMGWSACCKRSKTQPCTKWNPLNGSKYFLFSENM